ncbi:MAG: apolipoprotein N-acyltransferase [Planctomycetota bacterium]|nr:MAG: apolipoprotein N-acyltransferase [Planctomycetota bacterium]
MRNLWLPLFAAGLRLAALPGWPGPGWLAALSLVPRLAWWERAGRGRRRFLGDWLGGLVFWLGTFSFLAHTFWALPFGPAPVLALAWGAEGALFARLRRRLPRTLAAAGAILLVEWMRARWPMGGVPWASWGIGLAGTPGGPALAAVVGEAGLAILVLLAGAFLAALAARGRRRPVELILFPALLLLLGGTAARTRRPEPVGGLDTLCIQPGIEVGEKTVQGGRARILDRHLELGNQAVAEGERLPTLLVWAETMFLYPVVPEAGEGILRLPRRGGPPAGYDLWLIRQWQREGARKAARILAPGGWFLTGAHAYGILPAEAPPDALSPRSSEAVVFAPDGALVARARKTELVPFGERLPFSARFPGGRWLADRIYDGFGLHPTFVPGSTSTPLELIRPDGSPFRLGTAICWENVFPAVFRHQADEGAAAFLVLSNEAWFGPGAEMDQMVAASRLRAAETGRAVLRATNTGPTVLVGPGGGPVTGIPRGRPGWFRTDLPLVPAETRTPFLRGGWLFEPVAVLLVLAAALLPARRRPRPEGAGSA